MPVGVVRSKRQKLQVSEDSTHLHQITSKNQPGSESLKMVFG